MLQLKQPHDVLDMIAKLSQNDDSAVDAAIAALRSPIVDDDVVELPLDQLQIADDVQARAKIDEAAIAEYALAMARGDMFPAIDVCHVCDELIVVDGVHRFHAARRAGLSHIRARVRTGDRSAARLIAGTSNWGHGLRRSRADTQAAIKLLLGDPVLCALSDRHIGRLLGVDGKTVGKFRSPQPAADKPAEIPQAITQSPPGARAKQRSSVGGLANRVSLAEGWIEVPLPFDDQPLEGVVEDCPTLSSDLQPSASLVEDARAGVPDLVVPQQATHSDDEALAPADSDPDAADEGVPAMPSSVAMPVGDDEDREVAEAIVSQLGKLYAALIDHVPDHIVAALHPEGQDRLCMFGDGVTAWIARAKSARPPRTAR